MTNDLPAVSVLVTAYRVTAYIAEALDSVFAQTFRDFEVILVNDGCPDTENLEIVLKPYFSRIRYIKQANGGSSAARNTAILAARAPLVSLLDGDDAWLPEYLECQLGFLRANPHVVLVYPNMINIGGRADGTLSMDRTQSEGEVTVLSLLLQRCVVLNAVTMRRDIVIQAGLWDPAAPPTEDFDLWVRIAHLGPIAYQRKPLACYRVRDASLSSVRKNMLRGQLRVYSKVEPLAELEPGDRERVRQKAQFVQAELDFEIGWECIMRGDERAAIELWTAAQSRLRSAKLGVALRCLRCFPRLTGRGLRHYGPKYLRAGR